MLTSTSRGGVTSTQVLAVSPQTSGSDIPASARMEPPVPGQGSGDVFGIRQALRKKNRRRRRVLARPSRLLAETPFLEG